MTRRSMMYKQVRVSTASPGELIVMLFDGMVRFVRVGERAMAANMHTDTAGNIAKALAILDHLRESLDLEAGGHVARSLDTTYAAWMQVLVKGNLERDAARLGAVATQMTDLAIAWRVALGDAHAATGA